MHILDIYLIICNSIKMLETISDIVVFSIIFATLVVGVLHSIFSIMSHKLFTFFKVFS